MGRPTDYDPDYCQRVIDLGKEGKSVTQMACELDVNKDTLYEWAKVHEEFSDAFTRARQWAQNWWENKGQAGLETSGFNASLWSRSMAARFPEDYTERQKRDLQANVTGSVSLIERNIVRPKD